MQEKKRRSNATRTEEMRARLIATARNLFADKGFADTGTPEIVKAADVTRGALYHHFEDKTDLFRAVVTAEAAAVAADITSAAKALDADDALEAGTRAYFAAMAKPGRVRLLLIDAFAVLGHAEVDRIEAGSGRATLVDGLRAAMPNTPDAEIDALAMVLSAAFDRAAMAVADGADPEAYIAALNKLLRILQTG